MKKILLAFITTLLLLTGFAEEVLYWMVTDTSEVHYSDGSSVKMPLLTPAVDDITLAARVRVVGSDLEDVFLDIYGDGDRYPGDMGLDFYDGGGYWGVGNPTGIQAPLGSYSSAEYSFMIEIGNYDWNNDNWTTVATSASTSYSALSRYIFTTFDINPPTTQVWNPQYYTAIPEPDGGVLLLIGFALLMLKRNKTQQIS